MELIETNIQTTSVHPGGIKTNIVRNSTVKGQFATQEMLAQSVEQFDKNAPTTAEQAAQQILNAVENNKKRLLIGNDAKLIDIIIRLFPVSFTKIFIGQMEKAFTNPYKNKG